MLAFLTIPCDGGSRFEGDEVEACLSDDSFEVCPAHALKERKLKELIGEGELSNHFCILCARVGETQMAFLPFASE